MAGLTEELKAQGIRYIRFVWCDNANVLRAKVVPINFLRHAYQRGVGISFAQQGVPVVRDAFVAESGLGPVGEARLVGDWASLVHLPYFEGHARVVGNMFHQGKPWAHCPRAFLNRMVQKAASQGVQIQAAFENEFYFLRPAGNGFVPLDNTLFCSVRGLDQSLGLLTEVVEQLDDQGSEVVGFHVESGGGQMEVSVNHRSPMRAADQQITIRETVHAVAHRHGLMATFLPKPFPNRAGSGCHIHMSLWKDGKNITNVNPKADPTSSQFVAGILKHLPALMAMTTPTENSFLRLGRHLWSGAFACWGFDNREAAIRMPTNPYGVSNFEVKTHDATANPYLALGAIIAAGLDGVKSKAKLADPVDVDPGLLSAADLKNQKIKELPKNLKTVLKNLDKSKVLKEAMGEDLHRSYLAVKNEELASTSKISQEEQVEMLLQSY